MSYSSQRVLPGINVFFWRRLSLGQFFLFLVALVLAGVFYVWSHSQMIELGYDISRCESRLRTLAREENCLRLEAASLKNPARIERLARQQLGLHNPQSHQVIIVR